MYMSKYYSGQTCHSTGSQLAQVQQACRRYDGTICVLDVPVAVGRRRQKV